MEIKRASCNPGQRRGRRDRICFVDSLLKKSIYSDTSFSCLSVASVTTVWRLRGHIGDVQIDNVELHVNPVSRTATLHSIPSQLVSTFRSMFLFLFPPSLPFLLNTATTEATLPLSACVVDDTFQRDITISSTDGKALGTCTRLIPVLFFLGSRLTIFDSVLDRIIEFNGSFPRDHEFENETLFTETIIQTDSGMWHRRQCSP